ncbi:4-(cytidine 5'-diphospho)-2-C-methyl-D-erythritol kinase [Corynebacterium zhongnanshanii]|uniref:4-diphosphocytidyl-2-C-methyl-D-erythritol kinase n=1 Tax=Corynebacterium zhongnanshanii TaxID=2768834 RepID=A0ABQ6VFA6_9CORY|nr:4-(cytidine 5'-diphospho)-2-C-methyl-D-erythritol kinase [Corynebacterium zhongnanshanii]KAB3523060.1 4-(cytidine 5'-diphospho)-2-C-methyl-D-erythritol kinase [Corynebacterium zhongnanshanii]
MSVTAVAHGKVNLHLSVGDVRPDGYHELTTIFQSLNLREQVRLSAPEPGEEPQLTVEGHSAHLVPTDSSNLAWRAVELLAQRRGRYRGQYHADDAPAFPHIHITKEVPVAGGMAGGSADAAAALRAGVEYFGMDIDQRELMGMAATLGADVPFCLLGGTALGTGKGEELVNVPTRGQYHWAIATDKRGLSTPTVFAKLDEQRAAKDMPRAGAPDGVMQALLSGDPHRLGALLANDLQAPAISLMPSLRETLAQAAEAGAIAAIVSGSGPTIAMLCESEEHAVDVATAVAVSGTASATAVTSSPGVGAHLI